MKILEVRYRGPVNNTIITMSLFGKSTPALELYVKWQADLPQVNSVCFLRKKQISFFSLAKSEPVTVSGVIDYLDEDAREYVGRLARHEQNGSRKASRPRAPASTPAYGGSQAKSPQRPKAEREAEQLARSQDGDAPKEVLVEHRRGGVLVGRRTVKGS